MDTSKPMKPNDIRKIWGEGRCVLNGWLSIANAFSAEIMAEQGYDSIGIDLKHRAEPLHSLANPWSLTA
jgi:4-hydroxy-2-oxoheptanedioate aldolase